MGCESSDGRRTRDRLQGTRSRRQSEITFDIRFTEGNSQALPGKATELVDKRVDLIFTSGDAAIHAAYNASEKIPIVFTQVGDNVVPRLPQIGHNNIGKRSLVSRV